MRRQPCATMQNFKNYWIKAKTMRSLILEIKIAKRKSIDI